MPVAVLVIVTSALATTACCASRTVPETVPTPVCAATDAVKIAASANPEHRQNLQLLLAFFGFRLFIVVPPYIGQEFPSKSAPTTSEDWPQRTQRTQRDLSMF